MTNNKKTNNIYTIPFTLASKLQHCCLLNKISSLLKALHTSPQPVTPVVEYSNPEVDQARIIKENRGKSGVYR
jgi:hypothetical protein